MLSILWFDHWIFIMFVMIHLCWCSLFKSWLGIVSRPRLDQIIIITLRLVLSRVTNYFQQNGQWSLVPDKAVSIRKRTLNMWYIFLGCETTKEFIKTNQACCPWGWHIETAKARVKSFALVSFKSCILDWQRCKKPYEPPGSNRVMQLAFCSY